MYSRFDAGGGSIGLNCMLQRPGTTAFQPLQHRLGTNVRGDLGAAERVAVERDLHHRPEADRSRRKRSAQQLGRVGMGAGGRRGPRRGLC
jgi:hypothetical protein